MNKSKKLAASVESKRAAVESAVIVCERCKLVIIDLLDLRIRRILDVGRKDGTEAAIESSESHCFHLMEIKRILIGEKTCGVFDDFG